MDDHNCWWTRHRLTELTHDGTKLLAAGVPRRVLETLASFLGERFSAEPSDGDEFGDDIHLGSGAGGHTHDDCFVTLEPASEELKRAALAAVLSLHARDLDQDLAWSDVHRALLEHWKPQSTLRLRSHPTRKVLTARFYRAGAGWLERYLQATEVIIDLLGQGGQTGGSLTGSAQPEIAQAASLGGVPCRSGPCGAAVRAAAWYHRQFVARLRASPSSRGPGRGPFKAKTRVRIPLGTPQRLHRRPLQRIAARGRPFPQI